MFARSYHPSADLHALLGWLWLTVELIGVFFFSFDFYFCSDSILTCSDDESNSLEFNKVIDFMFHWEELESMSIGLLMRSGR